MGAKRDQFFSILNGEEPNHHFLFLKLQPQVPPWPINGNADLDLNGVFQKSDLTSLFLVLLFSGSGQVLAKENTFSKF